MDREEFAALVRDALVHLYDLSYLGRHQLNEGFPPETSHNLVGQNLHRILLEGIEGLRPPARVPPTANAWRPYQVLLLRYGEERTTEQVAQEIGISLRQLRREHSQGVQRLTDLLWEQYQMAHPSEEMGSAASVVDSEVARLGGARVESVESLEIVTQSVLSTLERHAAARNVTLTALLPYDLPRLPIERTTLRQILLSLLTYVIEAGGAGAIAISARRQDNEVSLSIVHQNPSWLPEPSQQANSTPPGTSQVWKTNAASNAQTDDHVGRLAVAEQLISAQGGRLQITRDVAFTLTLVFPVRAVPRVLVIDDNPEIIQLFRRYLGGGLYDVVGAASGEEGLRMAQELRPLAVILDVMMTDQDGWEVLQHLKNLPATKHIPVIVCSVLNEWELAFSLGASEFVAKPVRQQTLLAALTSLAQSS